MKLSTSTGDFSNVSTDIAERILCYEGTGFRYINAGFYSDWKPGMPLALDEDNSWRRLFDRVGDAAAKAGVTIIMGHATGEAVMEGETGDVYVRSALRCIEGFSKLGVKDLVVHPYFSPDMKDKKAIIEANKKFYSLLLPAAEKYNIYILAENNFNKNTLLDSGKDVMDILDAVNHPLLKVVWDTGHARLVKDDQYKSIITIGENLRGLHINDNDGSWDRHTGPFFGNVNFDPVLQGLVDIHYTGYFNFESDWVFIPFGKEEWIHNGENVRRLALAPKYICQQQVRLLHEIGVYMLKTYGVYEDS